MALRRIALYAALAATAACRAEPEKAGEAQVEPTCEAPKAEVQRPWSLRPRGDGVLELRVDQAPLLELRHGGFHKLGQSAQPRVRRLPSSTDGLAFEVTFESLPVRVLGEVLPPTGSEVRIDYTLELTQPLEDVAGVGLQLGLAAGAWDLEPQMVHIDGGRDIRVQVPGLGPLHVVFDPTAPPRTFVDPTSPSKIRAAWLQGDTPAGTVSTSVTISLPGRATLEAPLAERYGPRSSDRWHRDALVADDWPVDLSALNDTHGRAGSHGRVVVDGEDLRFEDGTPAKFWGTNLAASALFVADDATIEREAKRLSAFGYNLVRFHHHDSGWVGKNVFDTRGGTTQVLDEEALDRLDRWIETLANKGIYVYLDLHTGREFLPGDAIPGYADMLLGPHPRQSRGFQYINPRVAELLERYNEAALTRDNPHTGRPWAENPAVVGIQLTNENDLTNHFGRGFRPGTGRETHIAMFDALATSIVTELGLPKKAVRGVHRPGPGKVLLAEMQHRWDARAMSHLRSLGVRAPLSTTSFWGFGSLLDLPSLAAGDVIDAHSYGEAEALSTNPHRQAHWLHYIATAQVSGKPLTVTEWAVPKPAADRHTATLWMAAQARLQGWDAVMAFTYAQRPVGSPRRGPHKWDQHTDPAQIGLAPAAALMFRRGDIRLANETIAIAPSLEELWSTHASPSSRVALRTASERSRTVVVLPKHPKLQWDRAGEAPAGSRVVTDLGADLLEGSAGEVHADTGEIVRDWEQGVLRIDAPRAQAVSGWIGERTLSTRDLRVEVTTKSATVSAVSLDGRALGDSERILLTAVARATPQDDGSVRSEPVHGQVSIRTSSPLRIAALNPRARATDIPQGASSTAGVRDGEWVRLTLPEEPTHWFIIARDPR